MTLREAIKDWERRLGTLADGVPGIEPPAHLYSTIAKRMWGQGGQSIERAEVTPLRRSARRWRGLAVGAGALAACLALIVVWLFQNSPGPPTAFVAELHRNAGGSTADESARAAGPPGFVVSLDLAGAHDQGYSRHGSTSTATKLSALADSGRIGGAELVGARLPVGADDLGLAHPGNPRRPRERDAFCQSGARGRLPDRHAKRPDHIHR